MTALDLLPRIRSARAALPALSVREGWSRDRIEADQLERLNALWTHARRHVPHYRESDLPDRFDSLAAFEAAVPPLEKRLVREAPERFLSEAAGPGRWHRTGGSTGTPTRIFWGTDGHRASLRARYRALDRWGLDVLDRSAMLWGHGASVAPGLTGRADRLAQPLFDRLRRRLRLDAYDLSEAALDRGLDALVRFRPLSLYGYASAVARLADRAAATGIRVPSLRVAILTGEPAPPTLQARVADRLGCDVAVEYGSAETGVMATGHRDGTLRVRDDLVHLETVPAEGGLFDVLVTVFANPAFPLVRYRIGDVARAPIVRPETGFSVVPEIAGRRGDVLRGRDGRLVHACAVRDAVGTGAGRFRAHQRADGHVEVTFEGSPGPEVEGVADRLASLLGGTDVRIAVTDVLPGNAAGKHGWVASDLI